MRQDTWPRIWQLHTWDSLKEIPFLNSLKCSRTNAISRTQLRQTQGSSRTTSNFLPGCCLLVYRVCSYFLTAWNGMNKGKLQRLTPTGLKETGWIWKQSTSKYIVYVQNLSSAFTSQHSNTKTRWGIICYSKLRTTQLSCSQVSSFIIWFICAKTNLQPSACLKDRALTLSAQQLPSSAERTK